MQKCSKLYFFTSLVTGKQPSYLRLSKYILAYLRPWREHQQQSNDYTAQSCQLFIKNPLEYEFTFVTAGVDELRDGPRHDQPFLRGWHVPHDAFPAISRQINPAFQKFLNFETGMFLFWNRDDIAYLNFTLLEQELAERKFVILNV